MYYKLVSLISIHVGVSLFISVPEHKTAIIIILLKWDSLLCLYCFCLSPLQSTVTLTTVIVTNTMTRHIVLEYDMINEIVKAYYQFYVSKEGVPHSQDSIIHYYTPGTTQYLSVQYYYQ